LWHARVQSQVSPLQAAVLLNQGAVVDVLLGAGADPTQKGAMGMTGAPCCPCMRAGSFLVMRPPYMAVPPQCSA